MRKVLVGLLVAGLIGLAASISMADGKTTYSTGPSVITVSVGAFDDLAVTNGAIITLAPAAAGVNALTGLPDATGALNYTHNSATSRDITAWVQTADMPSGTQDITLSVKVAGGVTAGYELVTAGANNVAGVVVSDIAAGAITAAPLTYSASATAAKTVEGSYPFTVTFTSQDH